MLIDPFSKRVFQGSGHNGLISLMYHGIHNNNSRKSWPWSISCSQFVDQLDLLQDYGWNTICATNLLDSSAKLPPKSVLITFDDGYFNNYLAFLELTKRNMKGNWFIVTQDVGKMSSWGNKKDPSFKMLTETQLLEMQDGGMEIGSHTHSHCKLTQINPEQIHEELNNSKSYLYNLLNKPVLSFAYPYGSYNKSVLIATQKAGYQIAFTTHCGFGLVNDNLLEVRRISVMGNDSLSMFARKLAFADNDVRWSKLGAYVFDRLKVRLN